MRPDLFVQSGGLRRAQRPHQGTIIGVRSGQNDRPVTRNIVAEAVAWVGPLRDMLFGSSPIPKQYRAPRPTTLPGRSQHTWARLPRGEILIVLYAVLLVALFPTDTPDDWLIARTLHALQRDGPSTSTMVLRIAPDADQIPACGLSLAEAIDAADIQAVIMLAPADRLCAPLAKGSTRSVGFDVLAAPPEASLKRTDGHILGWSDCTMPEGWKRAGLSCPPWLLPQDPGGIPVVDLDGLIAGRVPKAAVARRIAVVEVGQQTSRTAIALAEAVASSREGGGRIPLSRPWVALIAALIALSLGLAQRRGERFLVAVAAGAMIALVALTVVLLWWSDGGVLPPARLMLVVITAGPLLQIPRALANRRAIEHAADLIERAALMRSDGLHTIPDAEFWPRVGDLAMQAHPADSVLVAELPPRKWHLKFWPYRGMGENVIKERRRDIRRTPYSNEQGTPDITVTRRYLVMEGTPVVVVPLIALGEVEGYVFLCGDTAERAYMASPEVAQRLSQDLGLMLRRRRIGQADERKWRSAEAHARGPGMDTAQLVEGAELALGELRIFNSLLRGAPVGLLYADPFGHVRVLGSAFAHWLTARGVAVPPGAASAPLSPGTLMLGAVLKALRTGDGPPITLAQVSERSEGVRFEIPLPADDHGPAKMTVFALRALSESADGVSWTAGFVGTLTEHGIEEAKHGPDALRLPLDPALDALSVQPLANQVRSATRAAAAASGRPVRFEPPRDLGNAIAYHRELEDALTDMLYDAASRDASGNGPVVTLEESGETVTIHIVDVLFGLPTSALKRAVLAPSDPPEGLVAFGRFVRAVSESHGRVELKEDDWGVQISAHLLRARPLVRRPSIRPPGAEDKKANSA